MPRSFFRRWSATSCSKPDAPMPTLIELTIFGDPKGQPRPRAFARRMGAKYVARVYDSDVADEWKSAVDCAILTRAMSNELKMREGPFAVAMTLVPSDQDQV